MADISVKSVCDQCMFRMNGQIKCEHLTQRFKAIETNIGPKHDRYDADDERRGDVDGIGGWERTNKDICQPWITELWWKRNERDEKVEDFERGTKPENDLMALGKWL